MGRPEADRLRHALEAFLTSLREAEAPKALRRAAVPPARQLEAGANHD